ncbi:MAG: hypothetical protein ACRC35_02390 [Angustibacter sp.]
MRLDAGLPHLLKRSKQAVDIQDMSRLDLSAACAATASDGGDIVVGWFARVLTAMIVVGIVGFDAVSIGTAQLAVQDDAVIAARIASQMWQEGQDARPALASATEAATRENVANELDPQSLRLDADGTAYLVVRRRASTLVIKHIAPIRSWAEVHATATERSTTP